MFAFMYENGPKTFTSFQTKYNSIKNISKVWGFKHKKTISENKTNLINECVNQRKYPKEMLK